MRLLDKTNGCCLMSVLMYFANKELSILSENQFLNREHLLKRLNK